MGFKGVKFSYTSEHTGWPGDQNLIQLNPGKLNAIGWIPRLNSEEAVRMAAKKILEQNDYN
jgi:UDP-glucose 4-epimerase